MAPPPIRSWFLLTFLSSSRSHGRRRSKKPSGGRRRGGGSSKELAKVNLGRRRTEGGRGELHIQHRGGKRGGNRFLLLFLLRNLPLILFARFSRLLLRLFLPRGAKANLNLLRSQRGEGEENLSDITNAAAFVLTLRRKEGMR